MFHGHYSMNCSRNSQLSQEVILFSLLYSEGSEQVSDLPRVIQLAVPRVVLLHSESRPGPSSTMLPPLSCSSGRGGGMTVRSALGLSLPLLFRSNAARFISSGGSSWVLSQTQLPWVSSAELKLHRITHQIPARAGDLDGNLQEENSSLGLWGQRKFFSRVT